MKMEERICTFCTPSTYTEKLLCLIVLSIFFIHSVSLTRTEIPRALLDALLEKQEVNVACVTGSEWSTAH